MKLFISSVQLNETSAEDYCTIIANTSEEAESGLKYMYPNANIRLIIELDNMDECKEVSKYKSLYLFIMTALQNVIYRVPHTEYWTMKQLPFGDRTPLRILSNTKMRIYKINQWDNSPIKGIQETIALREFIPFENVSCMPYSYMETEKGTSKVYLDIAPVITEKQDDDTILAFLFPDILPLSGIDRIIRPAVTSNKNFDPRRVLFFVTINTKLFQIKYEKNKISMEIV